MAQTCDEVLVLRHGAVVEHGPTARVLRDPSHEYTSLLIDEHNNYGLDRFRSAADGAPDPAPLSIDDELDAVLRGEGADRVR